MLEIHLPSRFSDNFGDPLNAIFNLLHSIESSEAKEIVLNYKEARFTHPFFSLAIPLIMAQSSHHQKKEFRLNTDFKLPAIVNYMNHICFPNGLNPQKINEHDYVSYLKKYENKTYIPIISFPVGQGQITTDVRDHFLSAVNKLLMNICKIRGAVMTALMYLIDEAINNVLHHSYDDFGYLHAQYYPSKGYLDLTIADIGRTILESYHNSVRYKDLINNHEAAMRAALDGKSTKSNQVDRGYGISTSKEMLTKGLNGKYFLFSGDVFNIHTSEINDIVKLDETMFWQGALLCLRIPVVAKLNFEPSDFYE